MLCSALLDQQRDGDLLLTAGDILVRAHSAFLRCLSPKLAALLATVSSCSSCRSTSVVHFDETSPAALRAIVSLLYKGEVNMPLNQVSEAYDLAQVFGLKVFIEQKRSSNCLEENGVSIEKGFGGTDVGDKTPIAEKEKGNYLKKPNAENRKRQKVNTNRPSGKEEMGKCVGSPTAKEVDGDIDQVEGTNQEEEISIGGERREGCEEDGSGKMANPRGDGSKQTCRLCGVVTSNIGRHLGSHFKARIEREYMRENSNSCTICGRAFSRPQYVFSHIAQHHKVALDYYREEAHPTGAEIGGLDCEGHEGGTEESDDSVTDETEEEVSDQWSDAEDNKAGRASEDNEESEVSFLRNSLSEEVDGEDEDEGLNTDDEDGEGDLEEENEGEGEEDDVVGLFVEIPYSCGACGEGFESEQRFMAHLASKHYKARLRKEYGNNVKTCPICGSTYARSFNQYQWSLK